MARMKESKYIILSVLIHGLLFSSVFIDWKWKKKQQYIDSDVLLMGPKTGDKINPPKPKNKDVVKEKRPVDTEAPKVYDKTAADSSNEDEGQFGQGGTKALPYDTELQLWLKANKRYPKLAKRLGQECDNIVITFNVYPDGRLDDIILKEKCQYDILNQAAMDQVRASSPFKPFPPNFPSKPLARTLPFSYKLGEQ